jgi:16S rRNA A1518/A1519 N6-dimethyltransferase RsmA/KsgA/DIM1 with predicted DNA glycosylase/AP lyase activity
MKPDTWCESEAGNSESLDHWLCRSGLSRRTINKRFLPWLLNGIDLGDDLLEIGPGQGMTTDLLQARVGRLTAIEVDRKLALALINRLSGKHQSRSG